MILVMPAFMPSSGPIVRNVQVGPLLQTTTPPPRTDHSNVLQALPAHAFQPYPHQNSTMHDICTLPAAHKLGDLQATAAREQSLDQPQKYPRCMSTHGLQ
jgi:hypothetical protein